MGLLDDILKSTFGGQSGSGSQAGSVVKSVLDLLEDDRQGGGLDGLSRSFEEKGLGDVISSWIGTGANRSISPDQLSQVLGRGRIDELARKSGLSASQAPGILAAVLPALIDKLTPDGQVPQRAALADRGKALLESLGSIFGGSEKASAEPMQAAPKKADFGDVKGGTSSTAKPPAPAAAEETYTVVKGDSLSKIAKRVYGNANSWRRIYDANREVIGDDPDLIKPGQKLTIPPKA